MLELADKVMLALMALHGLCPAFVRLKFQHKVLALHIRLRVKKVREFLTGFIGSAAFPRGLFAWAFKHVPKLRP